MLWIKGNVLGDKYNVISYNKSENDKRYGVLKCSSIGSLKVGDFIELNCDTGDWLKDYSNFRPSVNTIAKIISIDGMKITIDHYCPFDFSVGVQGSFLWSLRSLSHCTFSCFLGTSKSYPSSLYS